jgi:hypothetical protein
MSLKWESFQSQLTQLSGLTPVISLYHAYGINCDLSRPCPQRLTSGVPGRTGILPSLAAAEGEGGA